MNPWQQPPGQPGWGAPPGPPGYGSAAGYGGYGYGYGYGQPQQPSGATAIIAAVLSFLGALANGIGAIPLMLGSMFLGGYPGLNHSVFVVLGVVQLAIAAGLVVGGMLLLQRKLAGRIVIAASCAAVMLITVISFIYAQSVVHNLEDSGYASIRTGGLGLRSLLSLVMPTVTMILALLSPTKRWCMSTPVTAPTGDPYQLTAMPYQPPPYPPSGMPYQPPPPPPMPYQPPYPPSGMPYQPPPPPPPGP